jgi:predicted transcriptional regulator
MDREPVRIDGEMTLLDAQEQFFLRYRWPWFAVVDPARHFLGVVRQQRVESEIAAGRPALPVTDVLEEDMPVRIGEGMPLESLLRAEGIARLGAMVAVDGEGVLRRSPARLNCLGSMTCWTGQKRSTAPFGPSRHRAGELARGEQRAILGARRAGSS